VLAAENLEDRRLPASLAPINRHLSPGLRPIEKPWMSGREFGGGWPSIPGYVKLRLFTAMETSSASSPLWTAGPMAALFLFSCEELAGGSG